MKVIKVDIGYKPELTLEKVKEIFSKQFDYDIVLVNENTLLIKQRDAVIAAKVTLKQKAEKTILNITDDLNVPTTQKILLYIGAFLLGCIGNIVSIILFFVLYVPKVRKFMEPVEQFAKNHPEFKK